MIKNIWIISLLCGAAMLFYGAEALCQMEEEAGEVESNYVRGSITSVDTEASTIVINYVQDEENQITKDITIMVMNSQIMDKNYDTVGFDALRQGDSVAVEYITDSENNNVALNIWLK
ncbi:MAG: hypothetical protein JW800_00275 [Candidatus Omnitrophica bacterium]|nr:hypothetical protein [Candidatus Omnitrophota bacterium]